MRSGAGSSTAERDLRLDFFRGLALFSIFIDHVDWNGLLAQFTIKAVGLSDAAEVFILISGYTAGMVYRRAIERQGVLMAGIDRLRASGIEVLCMDMQFSPQTHAIIDFDRYKSVLREVTDASDVPWFRRYDLMQHWAESGVFDLTTGDHDKLRLVASRLYDCIGRAVADFIAHGVQPEGGISPASSEKPQ